MKTFYLLIACLSLTVMHGQNPAKGSVAVTTKGYTDDRALIDLMRIELVDYISATFKSDSLKGKKFTLLSKEFRNGRLKKTDTIISKELFNFVPGIQSDSLNMRVISKNNGIGKIKISFMFDRFQADREFKAEKTADYSLRDYCAQTPVYASAPFYAFAYILPYEDKSGAKYWCAVESSEKNIEHWGREFGIKHYILFEMAFTD